MSKTTKYPDVTESSGTVFADLVLPNAEDEQPKAKLMLEVYRTSKARGLTQSETGEILDITQPHVSALMDGHYGKDSVGRLLESLNALAATSRLPYGRRLQPPRTRIRVSWCGPDLRSQRRIAQAHLGSAEEAFVASP